MIASGTGSHGDTVITGPSGNSTVTLGGLGNRITTGAGRDVITSMGGKAVIDAGPGRNVIRFAGAGSVVTGGAGNDALHEEGARNRIVPNPAGQGRDDIFGPVLSNGDVLDLRLAMAATAWTGTAATLGEYLRVGAAGMDTTVAIAPGKARRPRSSPCCTAWPHRRSTGSPRTRCSARGASWKAGHERTGGLAETTRS